MYRTLVPHTLSLLQCANLGGKLKEQAWTEAQQKRRSDNTCFPEMIFSRAPRAGSLPAIEENSLDTAGSGRSVYGYAIYGCKTI
jgi:hypothetical protein